MISMKTSIAIIVAAVVVGILMSLQPGMQHGWQRAVIAGLELAMSRA